MDAAAATPPPRGGGAAGGRASAPPPALTKHRACALQQELLAGYTAPSFQGKLAKLEKARGAHTEEFAEGRRALIRTVQAEVLPRYGFEASDEGARQMVLAVKSLAGSVPELSSTTAQIEEALRCDSRGLLSLRSAVALLEEQISALGSEEFQQQIQHLQRKGRLDGEEEFRLFCSRIVVALQFQWASLSKYGFEASPRGAFAMMAEIAKYLDVPEVARLLDELCKKLSMKPSARAVVRARLSSCCPALAERPTEPPERRPAPAAAAPQRRRVLSKARAVELLHSLRIAYTEPLFLRRLVECTALRGEAFRAALAGLVRTVQLEVLPHFGFPASDAGVRELNDALDALRASDAEVRSLYAAVEAVLLEAAGGSKRQASDREVLAVKAATEVAPRSAAQEPRTGAEAAPRPPAEARQRSRSPTASPTSGAASPLSSAPASAAPAEPSLTKSRAEALISDLRAAMALRGALRQPTDGAKAAEAVRQVLGEVLPRYRFEDSEAGLRLAWRAARPHLGDPAAAQEVVDRLFGGGRAAALYAGLLEEVTAPAFRQRLGELYKAHRSTSAAFARGFGELVDPVLDAACARHGLPAAAALAPPSGEAGLQPLVAAVDDALYGVDSSGGVASISLREVVGVLRSQLAALSRPAFQQTVEALKRAAPAAEAEGYFTLPGRREALLEVQREVLRRHGLDDSPRGAHIVLARASQYLAFRQVAALLDAVNAALGMAPAAQRRFRERLGSADAGAPGAAAGA